jgi:hypothetical protein
MSQVAPPGQRDTRFERYRWLLQVSHLNSMMARRAQASFEVQTYNAPTRRRRKTLIQAMALLIIIVKVQLEYEFINEGRLRYGSKYNWYRQCLLHEGGTYQEDHDPSTIDGPDFTISIGLVSGFALFWQVTQCFSEKRVSRSSIA